MKQENTLITFSECTVVALKRFSIVREDVICCKPLKVKYAMITELEGRKHEASKEQSNKTSQEIKTLQKSNARTHWFHNF